MALAYASGPMPNTAPIVTVNPGAGSLTAGSYTFNYHAENIAGYSIASPGVPVSIADGDSITIALPPNAHSEISEWFYFHVTARKSDRPASESYRIALWNAINSQGAEISLPPVTIASDNALADPEDNIAATPDNLPTTGAIAGTTRFVSSTGLFVKTPFQTKAANGEEIILDGEGGKWTRLGGSPYLGLITNSKGEAGCDAPINSLDPRLLRIPEFALYTPSPNVPKAPSRGVGYYYHADETLLKGLPFRFVAKMGSLDSTTDLLNRDRPDSGVMGEKLLIKFKGYVNPTTGELDDKDITTDTGQMRGIGENVLWRPTIQQFYVPKDCVRPWAIWWEISPYYSEADFGLSSDETCYVNVDMGREVPTPSSPVTLESIIPYIIALRR